MQYLCAKQLTAGGTTYYPGEIIPDGVILPERSGKLINNGYISEMNAEVSRGVFSGQGGLFTGEQVDAMITEAVAAELEKSRESMQAVKAELVEMESVDVPETVLITVNRESDGENEQVTAVPATPQEIQQVFSIMQLNAEEGAKAITEVQSENVLILLHAADSRKTIKNAAKERADNLFSVEGVDT
ncbi:MAG: hypothetical protein K2N51_15525 [Lachnospiraceae bacterium]|nr:hypothetical protein [Lachnospiraceae bacterium]